MTARTPLPLAEQLTLGASLLWLGWWVFAAALAVPGENASPLQAIGMALLLGVLPCLPIWLTVLGRARARRAAAISDAAETQRSEHNRRRQQVHHLARLPGPLLSECRDLVAAHELVDELGADGWIDQADLREVDEHVMRLLALVAADHRTDALEGASSSELRGQVTAMRALLVALADAAIEHQSALLDETPAPATLAEARTRLQAGAAALRDLQQPG